MNSELFLIQFDREIAVVLDSLGTPDPLRNRAVLDAYDDLSRVLGLTYPGVALLAWALGNMDGTSLDIGYVSSLIGYAETSVSESLDELVVKHYMVSVESEDYAADVTQETKERIINHFCFGRLIYY